MRNLALFACVLTVFVAAPTLADPQFFNGVASYEPANGYDAPLFRQFAFVDGIVTQYHVLTPEVFFTDDHRSKIYQFPMCLTLDPVLEKHHPVPGEGFQGPHDAPTRMIVDVVLATGCTTQPKSVAEIEALALVIKERSEFWVNAPIIPKGLMELEDEALFNAPPHRPRIPAWQEGDRVQFITYEANWYPDWVDINFPAQDSQVFIISYGALFRPDFTILNTAFGTPRHESAPDYSPIWEGHCIVDADDQKCMVSVNEQRGYEQCRSVDDCLALVNPTTGKQVKVKPAPTFTHINCPMVAVDLNGDDYIAPWEELIFPDLWANGPVIV